MNPYKNMCIHTLTAYFLAAWWGVRNLNYPSRDGTWAPCSGGVVSWPLESSEGSPSFHFSKPQFFYKIGCLALTHPFNTHPLSPAMCQPSTRHWRRNNSHNTTAFLTLWSSHSNWGWGWQAKDKHMYYKKMRQDKGDREWWGGRGAIITEGD